MNKKPLVSCIISTYNRKKLLKRAIKSVLAQTVKDFELIVVDDCSTDKTEKLVRSFGDERIIYLRTEKNSGHDGKPKNLGILKARGEYTAFLDDDDFYRPEALKILSTYMDETDADVAYGDYLQHHKGKKAPGWSLNFSPSLMTKMNYISMCVVMVKTDTLRAVGGFDEAVPKFKDWNLWVRIQKWGGQFIHIPIIVSEVTSGDNTISKKFKNDEDERGQYLPTYFNPADCKIWPDNTSLGKAKPLKVAIYTLTWNRLDYTKMMHEAMKKTAGYDFDWFVVDQGSKDGTQKFLGDIATGKNGQRLQIHHNKKNEGISKGWNRAIKMMKDAGNYDIVIKIDNDAQMMTEGWLKAMVDIFERNRTMILSPCVEGLEGSPGGVLRRRQSGESPYFLVNDLVLGYVPNLGGICFATPIKLFDDFTFDEGYEGNKDYLLSMYAKSKGYSLFYLEEYRVKHIDGTKGQHKRYPDYFKDPENKSVVKDL